MAVSFSPVAVVTGGARGIGLAIGQWFLAHEHKVVLLDIDQATLAVSEAALNRPHDLLCLRCDVASPQQVQAAAAQVMARFGRLDALVNNAGVAVFKPALETHFEEWRQVLSTNLDGAFLCPQAVLVGTWPASAAAPSSTLPPSRDCVRAPCGWPMAPARPR